MDKLSDFSRMVIWLLLGLMLYFLAMLVGSDKPAVQTVLYKMGHVTTLAWVGYWISRQALGRIVDGNDQDPPFQTPSNSTDRLARAVIIAGVIIAGSLGL